MLISRFDPFREMRELRRGFNYLNSAFDNLDESKKEIGISSFTPSVNTREGEYAYHVEVDLPGVKKEDIHVDVKDNVLSISGERVMKEEVKEDEYYMVESSYGKFERSFTLPDSVDVEDIHAESKDGVLEVVIPKMKVVKEEAKKIEIK
jgi:HSP20 family protein